MTITIETFIAELKEQHPTLTKGDDVTGYEELNAEEYEALILDAANDLYKEHLKEQEKAEKLAQKTILLERLGMTAEELDVLLGQ